MSSTSSVCIRDLFVCRLKREEEHDEEEEVKGSEEIDVLYDNSVCVCAGSSRRGS